MADGSRYMLNAWLLSLCSAHAATYQSDYEIPVPKHLPTVDVSQLALHAPWAADDCFHSGVGLEAGIKANMVEVVAS